jgi:hypothetical protein
MELLSEYWSSTSPHEEVMKDLMKELRSVRMGVLSEYQRLKRYEEDKNLLKKRKRLIYLFVKDLSRGVSGDVLFNKYQRDSEISLPMKTDRVTWWLKWSGWIFVGLLNAAMLFYVYLFAMNQTRTRQQAWFVSFVMWLGFEIFLSSTSVVILIHLLLPLYVWTDVSELKQKVLGDLVKFQEKFLKKKKKAVAEVKTDEEDGAALEFNAAKFLFTSWRVASLFPELHESQLILQFSTLWPKKKFGNEEGDVAKEYEDDIILSAVWQIFLFFLASLLQYNTLIQDIVIQTACNSGLGALCLLLIRLWTMHPWLAVLASLALLLCLYLLGKFSSNHLAKKLRNGSIYPIDSSNGPTSAPPKTNVATGTPLHEAAAAAEVEAQMQIVDEGDYSDDDGESLSFENISVSDSNSSGIPSLGPFVWSDSALDSEDSELEGVSSISSSEVNISVVQVRRPEDTGVEMRKKTMS